MNNDSKSEAMCQKIGQLNQQQHAADLLNHIFWRVPASVFVELTYILPPALADIGPSPITIPIQLGRDGIEWDQVDAMNATGYGVYYGLTAKSKRAKAGRRAREIDTAWCSVLWVDVDMQDGTFESKSAADEHLMYMRPVPSAIVDSGGGLHGLWRIKPVKVDKTSLPRIKQTLRGLALAAKGDPHVAELARVFRLPDTINTKPERNGARCVVRDILPLEYTLDDFRAHYDAAEPVKRELQREFTRHKPESEPGYISWYVDQAHVTGERNSSLNWTAHKMASDGYAEQDAIKILLPRALADGLTESASLATIASAFKGKKDTPSYVMKSDRVRMAAGDIARRAEGGTK